MFSAQLAPISSSTKSERAREEVLSHPDCNQMNKTHRDVAAPIFDAADAPELKSVKGAA